MANGTLDGLLAYVTAQRSESTGHLEAHYDAPVVTITTDHGAGGVDVGAMLSEKLGVPCFNKAMLDSVIKEVRSDPGLLHRLDEELPPRAGTALYAAFLGIDDPLEDYRRLMARVLGGISRGGGVVLGRGAHLMVHGDPMLRVRLIGSIAACGWRLAAGDPMLLEAKRAEVVAVNAEKTAFMRKCFNVDRNDPQQYDLVINTDRFATMAPVVELILLALSSAGRMPIRGRPRAESSKVAA